MSDIRKRACSIPKKRQSAFERAQHVNAMQSRTFYNQLDVLEHNIQKKLKIIENEKRQVSRYLYFLKSSSGTSPCSVAPNGKLDTPRIRPATAGVQRMKFGIDGNANHSYMASDPIFGWRSKDDNNGPRSDVRARSACMSRTRISSHRTTLSRVRKIEEPLKKRVSWIDGGDGGDDGIRGYSAGIRAYSAKGSLTRPLTASTSTQYDPDYSNPSDYVIDDEAESMTSLNSSRTTSARKNREIKPIQPINITFPFPVTPDRYRSDEISQSERGNQFMTFDKRRGLMATVTTARARTAKN